VIPFPYGVPFPSPIKHVVTFRGDPLCSVDLSVTRVRFSYIGERGGLPPLSFFLGPVLDAGDVTLAIGMVVCDCLGKLCFL